VLSGQAGIFLRDLNSGLQFSRNVEDFCERCLESIDERAEDCFEIEENGRLKTLCAGCFEIHRQTPQPEPVIIWRDRPQVVSFTEPCEKLYTIAEAAETLGISASQATNLFRSETGVIDFATKLQGKRLGKKRHKSALRIPQSVLDRVKNLRARS
jgi:hypothetical protein